MAKRIVSETRRKRVRVIGTQEYINATTGELERFEVMSIEERDANFSKLWLGHILQAIDEIGNAKMRILAYILAQRDKQTNIVVKTYKEIAQGSGTSLRTVVATVSKLLEHDIVRQKAGTKGVLFINPNVVFKGGTSNRLKVLLEYRKLDDLDDDENKKGEGR